MEEEWHTGILLASLIIEKNSRRRERSRSHRHLRQGLVVSSSEEDWVCTTVGREKKWVSELGDEGKEPRADEDRRGSDEAGAGWRSRFIRRGRREWWGARSSLVTEKKTQIYMIGGGGSQTPSDLATAISRHREEKNIE
ncbi:hypothetical protein L484_021917 [Morus notabilis]|uniref:Uncharacterized protein n=1 Tax=Morus notabilis TaxID=981085 RepID=W9SEK4_9ROSA|nr:hypothetical protein L484_021917 [Morus notabilis]